MSQPAARVVNLLTKPPLNVLSPMRRCVKLIQPQSRPLSTTQSRKQVLGLVRVPERILPIKQSERETHKRPTLYPPPQSARSRCKDPIATLTALQLTTLDPTGARSRLFATSNAECAKVGDILLVRQKNGDPFAGVCLNIRRQGIDTAILLRNQLTRVGVEMWYKVYSPNVEGIEVVQRRVKRARRARLYYMRKPEHDAGSVQNVVTQYIRQRQVLRSGESKGRDANSHKKKGKGKKK